jgi:hypothetical protein
MRRIAPTLIVAVVLLAAQSAFAGWAPAGGGSGRSGASALGVPTGVTAAALGSTSVQVTWTAPAGVAPTGYVVHRTAPTPAVVCTTAALVCTDTGLSPSTTYSYTVTATRSAWSSAASSPASATTSGPPSFVVTSPGAHTAGTAFNATLTATTNGVTTDTSYTGVKTITFSGPGSSPGGTAPLYPATVTFTAGVGTASIRLYAAGSTTLSATDGTRSGSVTFTVATASANRLRYTGACNNGATITVGNGGSFTAFVVVTDTYLNPFTQTSARTVSMTRNPAQGTLAPTSLTVPVGATTTTASFTYTLPVGNPPTVTVRAASAGLTAATCLVKKN